MKIVEKFIDWVDFDLVLFEFGKELGFFCETKSYADYKYVLMTKNEISDMLINLVHSLINYGTLLFDEDMGMVKFNAGFRFDELWRSVDR